MSRTQRKSRRIGSFQSKPRHCSGKAKCSICEGNTEYKNERQTPLLEAKL